MTWAESVKREFTERIQFTRNVGKNARMRSQCVPGLALSKEHGYEARVAFVIEGFHCSQKNDCSNWGPGRGGGGVGLHHTHFQLWQRKLEPEAEPH